MDISLTDISQPHTYVYENLYKEMNVRGNNVIPAQEAATYLKRSNLNVTTLGQIWELADYNRKGYLDKTGAFIALKLVAACQQGHPISRQSLLLRLDPPTFSSRSATPSTINFGMLSATNHSDHWAISSTDQAKYESIFDGLNPVDGKVSGDKVRPVLLNSGLPSTSLARIWELADMDKDGKLDRIEMCIALHLVYCALQGEAVPVVLPPSLIHPTKRGLVHPFANVSPVRGTQWGTSRRSRTGSVASLETPVQQASGSERMRSQSVQPTVTTPTFSSPTLALSAWPVQTMLYEASFRQADSNQDGLVSGADVRGILLATGIPQNILAHLWSLVDMKKNGMLNLEQFALIMYLIGNFKDGRPVPNSLPPNLIPPSFRSIEASASGAASRYIMNTMSTGNEELDALQREVEKLILERREADQEIVQLEADMTVKNSEIKNLKIELTTLEDTVAQLEKQKGEAEQRLEALDTQIVQLERAVEQSKEKVKEEEARLNDLRSQSTSKEEEKAQDEEMIQMQRDIQLLNEEKRTLSATYAKRTAVIENASLQLAKLENMSLTIKEKAKRVEAENETLKRATERLTQLIERNDIEALRREQTELFAVLGELSSVTEKQGSVSAAFQSGDFTATGSETGFQTDPFGGTSTSLSGFDAFSDKDPFFSEVNSVKSLPVSLSSTKAPPPPRPAPPKTRQTSVSAMKSDPFSGTDPFAESGPTTTANNFADFANFEAFAKS